MADFAREEVPLEFRHCLTVVTFPQLGFLIEINMDDSDLSKVPLEFQVRACRGLEASMVHMNNHDA